MDNKFCIFSEFEPAGDQVEAIHDLCEGLKKNYKNQTLLGVTGSGKTFTIANVIRNYGKPTLVLAPNKTLASQLYSEFKEFFPENHVEYFVSYYNYYRPEAYVVKSDSYIEQQSIINAEIDKMRSRTIRAIVSNDDVVVVASVSCIYGICSPQRYKSSVIEIQAGDALIPSNMISHLIGVGYKSSRDTDLQEGEFCIKGEAITIAPILNNGVFVRITVSFSTIETIALVDKKNKRKFIDRFTLYPNSLFSTPSDIIKKNTTKILEELDMQVKKLLGAGKTLEADRLTHRVNYDLEMLLNTGRCKGIENYSRYFSSREPGQMPDTLMSFFQHDSLMIVDESHISVPQLMGMYHADAARKDSLVKYGWRLPSCKDNRPLNFHEWDSIRPNTIFVSATPAHWETGISSQIVHQIVRPTGLLDPICIVNDADNPVSAAIYEIRNEIEEGGKVMVITYTKRTAEHLSDKLNSLGFKSQYIHSDIKTLKRVEILSELRNGDLDIVIGINLLREGIDIPSVSLVVIFDTDKEGYLRSETSLIQIIGRAARNDRGRVIMMAKNITQSMKAAIDQTQARRDKQEAFNIANNIIPKTVNPKIVKLEKLSIQELEARMMEAAEINDFETAADLRDRIYRLKQAQASGL